MNITQHTPAPWIIREGDEWTCDIVTEDGVNVNGDKMYWSVASYNRTRDEAEANAKLIAVAPEMLALLIKVRSRLNDRWIEAKQIDELLER